MGQTRAWSGSRPLSGGALQRELPMIQTAVDAEAMRTHLEAALIAPRGPVRLRRCRPELRAMLRGARFALPECLGFDEGLQMVVFTEIPGVPQVAQLLRACAPHPGR